MSVTFLPRKKSLSFIFFCYCLINIFIKLFFSHDFSLNLLTGVWIPIVFVERLPSSHKQCIGVIINIIPLGRSHIAFDRYLHLYDLQNQSFELALVVTITLEHESRTIFVWTKLSDSSGNKYKKLLIICK